MTLFGKKRGNRETEIEENPVKDASEIERELEDTEKDYKDQELSEPEEICIEIKEAEKQIIEARLEYQAVTEYLSDIQKIDGMGKEARREIEEAARNIIMLTRERSQYQANDVKLADVQFRHIARYEQDMEKELKRMQENEDYDAKARSDMRKLDASIHSLKFENKDILESQAALKKMAWVSFGIITVMALLLCYMSYQEIMNMKIPFMGICVLAMGAGFFIFYESRKNHYNYLMNGKKMNKAIGLLNTVKIKYVNNKNALDYQCAKFMVSGYGELSKLWEEYSDARKEAEKYKSNTGMLNYYNNYLVNELKKIHLKDCEVWIYQAAAFIDTREMVEIRHRLNNRRQKLREQIDFNCQTQQAAAGKIREMMEENPDSKETIEGVMKKYDVDERIKKIP